MAVETTGRLSVNQYTNRTQTGSLPFNFRFLYSFLSTSSSSYLGVAGHYETLIIQTGLAKCPRFSVVVLLHVDALLWCVLTSSSSRFASPRCHVSCTACQFSWIIHPLFNWGAGNHLAVESKHSNVNHRSDIWENEKPSLGGQRASKAQTQGPWKKPLALN